MSSTTKLFHVRGRAFVAILAALFFAMTSEAQAGFQVRVVVDGGSEIFIPLSPVTGPSGSPVVINISSNDYDFGTFDINLTASSNHNVFTDEDGLDLTGNLTQTDQSEGASHTIVITLSDNSYTTPGPNYTMETTGALTHLNTTALDTVTFRSFAVPNAPSGLYGMDVPGIGIAMNGDTVTSGNPTPTDFHSTTLAFGLTNLTVLKMGAGDGLGNPASFNLNLHTLAYPNAVPEPGSVFLVALGGMSLVMARRIRGRTQARQAPNV